MATVDTSFKVSAGGLSFSSITSYTGTNVSVIDGSYSITTGNTDIPIYAEGETDGDIKLVIFECDQILDSILLLDNNNDTIIDVKTAGVGSGNTVANQLISLPGTALLPTLTGGPDDVQKLRISGTGSATAAVKCVIVFTTAAADTITDH